MKIPEPRQLPSKKWFIQLRIKGASIPITHEDKNQCVALAMAIKSGLMTAQEKTQVIALGKAIDTYITDRSNILSPCTIRVYKSLKKNHFKSLMKLDVYKVTRQQLQSAINEEAKSSSPKTVRNGYGLVTSVIADYQKLDLSRVVLPQKNTKERTVLIKSQMAKLYQETSGTDIEVQVLLASWLGLRRSEILALSWDAIDTKSRTISVTAAMVPGENGMVLKGTKTEKSSRVLTVDQYLIDRINAIERMPYNNLIFHSTATTMTNHLNDACDRAGLPHIGFHALRHTNASVMLSLNIPDKYAMERGGWSSNDTMKYIYQHTLDDEREAVNTAVDTYFKNVVGVKNANEDANAEKSNV